MPHNKTVWTWMALLWLPLKSAQKPPFNSVTMRVTESTVWFYAETFNLASVSFRLFLFVMPNGEQPARRGPDFFSADSACCISTGGE